jgi:hypothetical protein
VRVRDLLRWRWRRLEVICQVLRVLLDEGGHGIKLVRVRLAVPGRWDRIGIRPEDWFRFRFRFRFGLGLWRRGRRRRWLGTRRRRHGQRLTAFGGPAALALEPRALALFLGSPAWRQI